MTMRSNRWLMAMTGLAATTAWAQQEPAGVLDEITVTATRRAESVQDVPYNIQAISSQTLDVIGALEQRDFARMIPGLSMVDSGARSGVEFVLRGLTTGSNSGALGQTTTTYVDETQVDLYFGLLDLKLLDVDRIEVLRGPQGTLYGGGAIGGTLRYISTKPDLHETDARISTMASSTEGGGTNQDVSGMLNLPLVEGKLALRANLGYFDNDGYIDNVRLGTKRINWDRTTSGRVALLAQPIDSIQIDLTHYYQRSNYGSPSDADEFLGGRRVDSYAPEGEAQRRAGLTNLSVKFDFGWSELTSSSSYVRERGRNFDDNTYFLRDSVFASFLPPELLPELTLSTERLREGRTFTQEFRLVSKDTQRWDWLAGLYWYDSKTSEALQERVTRPFPGQADFEDIVIGAPLNDDKEYFFTSDPTKISQWAVFGEIGYRITPELRVSLGARHFDYRLRETFYAIDQFFGPDARDANGLARTTPIPEEYSFGRADDADEIYRLNASYDLTDDDLVYVTIAEGYRPGGFNLVTPNTGVPLDERQYDPDSIVSYEVGGKMSLVDRQVYLSTAVYYIDWSDIQTLVPTDLGFTIFGNAGKATARGFELEMQSRGLLADGLSMSIGYSYTNVQLEESIVNLGLKGDHAPRVPEHAGSLMADYEIKSNAAWTAGVNISTSYTGRSASAFGPLVPEFDGTLRANELYLEQEAYWLTNVAARFQLNAWTVRLFVDNVFNEDVDLRRVREMSDSQYRSPYVIRGVNQPRTVGLQLTWDLR
ncbi:TonB-dependent receptor [Steroidobacter flavus]|uniref:TonB-dependent receptor n=1 Tax=Steroidobacter flavus TaxID=1842136 RepID=A0ABV8T1I0_9GAMM